MHLYWKATHPNKDISLQDEEESKYNIKARGKYHSQL